MRLKGDFRRHTMLIDPCTRSVTGMTKKRILLALSATIALLDVLFVYINYRFTQDNLHTALQDEANRNYATFTVSVEQMYANLLMVATLYAEDPKIQILFHNGVKAVARESGGPGPGGEETAYWRNRLFDEIGESWLKASKDFKVRQLHFHLGPGSTSYLRVHRADKFGDNMDTVRWTIVETNRTQQPQTGFETGRVYSGLRGVVPVFAPQTDGSAPKHIGALEAGTSFANMIDILESGTGAAFSVLLTREHVESNMWESAVTKLFGDDKLPCGCVVEATSREGVLDIINAYPFGPDAKPAFTTPEILKVGDKYFSATFFPLRDFIGTLQPERDNVGSVLVWDDITETIAAIQRQQYISMAYAVFGYLFLEGLLLLSFWAVTRHLESTVKMRTRELSESVERERTLNESLTHEIAIKNRFFSIIAHDLRSPFNSLLGMTRLMRDLGHKHDTDTIVSFSANIADAGERFFELLQGLLEWSLHQMNRTDIPFEHFAIKPLIEQEIEILAPTASEKDVELTDLTAPHSAFGDAQMVATVLRNLMSNALKFVEPGGRIIIDGREHDGQVEISVTDTGTGIPDAIIDDLFVLDVKTSRTGTQGEVGTGLGLPLCHDLLARMGGTIRAENLTGPHQHGARFTITLPQAPHQGPD